MRKFDPDELASFDSVLRRLQTQEFMQEWEGIREYISVNVKKQVDELPSGFQHDFPSTSYASDFEAVSSYSGDPASITLRFSNRYDDDFADVPYAMLLDPYGWADKKIEDCVRDVKRARVQKERAVQDAKDKKEREEREQLAKLLEKYPDAKDS